MSIFDVVVNKKIWRFNGALIRPQDINTKDRAYPAIGLTCEVKNPDIIPVPSEPFYGWYGVDPTNPQDPGRVQTYNSSTRVKKQLQLEMVEPPGYRKYLEAMYPRKFSTQDALNQTFRNQFADLLFIEHGDYLLSNPMHLKEADIEGGIQLAVNFVIRLYGPPGSEAMIITGYWSDGYLGTGGWC